jgi:hypothetical protein
MDRQVWFSPRALKLHAVILIVVPAFMALCVWQLDRALGGNELSWAYVFEWPFFAAYAVYMWWRLLHAAPEGLPTASEPGPEATPPVAPGDRAPDATTTEEEQEDDADLAAYNAYLAELAERDRAAGR